MKKKIFSLVFALFMVIPCLFLLTACGNSNRDNYMEVIVVGNDDPGIVGFTLFDADEYSKYSSHSYFHWQMGEDTHGSLIPKGKNYLLMVEYTPGYCNGNLHVYINGEQSMFRKLAYELEEIGNPNYVDFINDDIYVDLWEVSMEAVNTITVTFGGQTEQEIYDVHVSHIYESSRQSIANYEDLRFSLTVNGEEQLPQGEVVDGLAAGATFEQFAAYFDQNSEYITGLIYGDQIIFKVWFDGRLVPFNNADLFSTYEGDGMGSSWYNPCARSYFDPATGESVYIFNIDGNESINMFWTKENQILDYPVNYDAVSLSLQIEGLVNGDFTAEETYTFAELKTIFANNGEVTFTIPNFKGINAKIIQSSFVTLDIGYNILPINEKAGIVNYNYEETLTLSFNQYAYEYYSGNPIFGDEGEDHTLADKPRLMLSNDYRANPNEYALRFYHDSETLYDDLVTNEGWQVTPVVKVTHEYNGTEFNGEYQFEDQSHINESLVMAQDEQASILYGSVMVFYGDDLLGGGITFDMSFNFFPAPTPDEKGELSSTSDFTRFEKITVTIGETSFDITVEEFDFYNEQTEQMEIRHRFVTNYDSSIDGLTVFDSTDNDGENVFVYNDHVQFNLQDGFINRENPHDVEIKFTYYLR